MIRVYDKAHYNRLNEYNVKIKTTYKDDKSLHVVDDNTKNDIVDGIRLEKEYYKDNKLVYKIKDFDPRIKYTFVTNNEDDKIIKCPNCGMSDIGKNFKEGCPYCGTYYNVDYENKSLGAKYHYDRAIKESKYLFITFVVDLIMSFLIMFCYIKITGRTFNVYDISKIFIYTIILAAALFYVFYMLNAFIITLPVKIYKDKINKRQIEFWNRMKDINKNTFYNNLNYELQNYFYKDIPNIIDYDIIDYIEFKEQYDEKHNLYICVKLKLRIVKIENNKIMSYEEIKNIKLEKNDVKIEQLNSGINVIKCRGCGASIDVTQNECEYCGVKTNYLQEWYLIK